MIIEVGGSVILMLGWQTRKIAWLLLAFVVVATVMGHRFWQFDGGQYVNQLNHFLKNIAIVGGLLYVAAMGGGTTSLDRRRPR